MDTASGVITIAPKLDVTPTDPLERGKYYKAQWREGLATIAFLNGRICGLQDKIAALESEVEKKKDWQPPQFYEDP